MSIAGGTSSVDVAGVPALVQKAPRFMFLDGLRGVASLSVMLYHFYTEDLLHPNLYKLFPHWIGWTFDLGARGVQIFFVLSGFVIAYSIRQLVITPRSAGNFILRRQIRLDPLYWLVLFVMFADRTFAWYMHPQEAHPTSLLSLVINMFYLQVILKQPVNYVGVSWTLCLEVQFYLLILILAWICQPLKGVRTKWILPGVVAGLVVASICYRSTFKLDLESCWFLGSWYLFGTGVLCYWTIAKRFPASVFLMIAGLILGVGIWRLDSGIIVGALTTISIFVASRMGHMSDWLSNPVLQYLGRISYSLYLTHMLVMQRVYKLGAHITETSAVAAVLWIVVASVVSVGVAHVLNVCVERPTMRLAERLKPRSVPQIPVP